MSIISCVFWPSLCLFWRNVNLGLPIFDWVVCFLVIDLYDLFVFFGNYFLVCCIIWKYFLSVYRLSFCFFWCKSLCLIMSHLYIFAFISFALRDISKKYWYNLCHSVLLCYLLGVLCLIIKSLIILSLLLFAVWGYVLSSFIYM